MNIHIYVNNMGELLEFTIGKTLFIKPGNTSIDINLEVLFLEKGLFICVIYSVHNQCFVLFLMHLIEMRYFSHIYIHKIFPNLHSSTCIKVFSNNYTNKWVVFREVKKLRLIN